MKMIEIAFVSAFFSGHQSEDEMCTIDRCEDNICTVETPEGTIEIDRGTNQNEGDKIVCPVWIVEPT